MAKGDSSYVGRDVANTAGSIYGGGGNKWLSALGAGLGAAGSLAGGGGAGSGGDLYESPRDTIRRFLESLWPEKFKPKPAPDPNEEVLKAIYARYPDILMDSKKGSWGGHPDITFGGPIRRAYSQPNPEQWSIQPYRGLFGGK